MAVYAESVAAEFGQVNAVINNAGVALTGSVADMSYADMEWIVDIDFWGVVNGTKEFLPYLIRSGDGHVVNLSSLFGLLGIPGQSAYNAAKFAVRGFTESLRQEMVAAKLPVQVTSVHPGGIKTAIARNARVADGEDQAALAEYFDRKLAKMPPERAAEIIVNAMLANKGRVIVGADAKLLNLLQLALGWRYQNLVAAVTRNRVPQRKVTRAMSRRGLPFWLVATTSTLGPATGAGRSAADPVAAQVAGHHGQQRCRSRRARSPVGAPWAVGRRCGSASARPNGRPRTSTCTAGRIRSARRAVIGRWPPTWPRPVTAWSICRITGWRPSIRTRLPSTTRWPPAARSPPVTSDSRSAVTPPAAGWPSPPPVDWWMPASLLPVALGLISPWVDPAAEPTGRRRDRVVREKWGRLSASHYLGSGDPSDAGYAPGRGNLAELPPTLVQVNRQEVLYDQVGEFAGNLRRAGVDVTLSELPRLWHVGHVMAGVLVDAQQAVDELGGFLKQLRLVRGYGGPAHR